MKTKEGRTCGEEAISAHIPSWNIQQYDWATVGDLTNWSQCNEAKKEYIFSCSISDSFEILFWKFKDNFIYWSLKLHLLHFPALTQRGITWKVKAAGGRSLPNSAAEGVVPCNKLPCHAVWKRCQNKTPRFVSQQVSVPKRQSRSCYSDKPTQIFSEPASSVNIWEFLWFCEECMSSQCFTSSGWLSEWKWISIVLKL